MNIFIKYNKIRKYESFWRENKDEMEYDDNDKPLPFPIDKSDLPDWKGKEEFLQSLDKVEKLLTRYKNFHRETESKDCLLGDANNVLNKFPQIVFHDSPSFKISFKNSTVRNKVGN